MKTKPMSEREWATERIAWWTGQFKDHQAKMVTDYPVLSVEFRKPGTSTNSINFVLWKNTLMVFGDLYEATYMWSQNINLEFLVGCNWHYFHGKCMASPHGRKFESWSEEVAMNFIHNPEDYFEGSDWFKELKDSDGDKESFDIAARTAYDDTGDAELASMISEAGMVPDSAFFAHFVAIGLVAKQLIPSK
jgi:hypothetical protein